MTDILPCKKCGWMPARFQIYTGYAYVNPHGSEPYGSINKEYVYSCINPDCGKPEDPALKKWNEANK